MFSLSKVDCVNIITPYKVSFNELCMNFYKNVNFFLVDFSKAAFKKLSRRSFDAAACTLLFMFF